MNILEAFEQDLILYEENPDPVQPSLLKESIITIINAPEFLSLGKEARYRVKDMLNIDEESPFNPNDLINSTQYNSEQLAQKVDEMNKEPYISLPFWELSIAPNHMRLDCCYSESYKNYIMSKADNNALSERPKNTRSIHKEQEEGKTYPISSMFSEESNHSIESLKITQATKELIRDKYFRGANHPDLENFRTYEKNASSLFYELFSVVFREKPLFEIEELPECKERKEYIAYLVLNKERILSGTGLSKKDAKAVSSLQALEIFAPSLALKYKQSSKVCEDNILKAMISEPIAPIEKLTEHPVQEKTLEIPRKMIMDTQAIDILETNDFELLEKTGPEMFEDRPFMNLDEDPTKVLDTFDSFGDLDFFFTGDRDATLQRTDSRQEIDFFSMENENDDSTYKLKKIESSQKKSLDESLALVKSSVQTTSAVNMFDIKCDSINGLKIGIPLHSKDLLYNHSTSEYIKRHGRSKAIQKVYDDLQIILKNDRRIRIDPKVNQHAEVGRSLKFYCTNNVFTKLYMLHCLLYSKESQTLQLISMYFDRECYVYLYASELEQTFMYSSDSLVMSIEMAKYFLVFNLYKKCRTVVEIIETMKIKFDSMKEAEEVLNPKVIPTAPNISLTQAVTHENLIKTVSTTEQEKVIPKNNQEQKENIPRYVTNLRPKTKQKGITNNGRILQNRQNIQDTDDDDDLLEITEAKFDEKPIAKKNQRIILEDMADDIENMFKEKAPLKKKKMMTVKDQMFADLDTI